ncbi:histidine kinase [Chitinophaga parva]|uniref:Histidine kinase n=1 Tax=Chitinophaga parva TaxID=2169414 RepID=A0A2T7BIJ3_9BACT|nr:histidine kinase [Chitinophaga parva]PUZ26109.1 histidine kinase [Chitinophaga parva]
MIKNEGKIYLYSSLLIALVVNSAKLMALNTNGIIARYWQFNVWEYTFQLLYNMSFCLLILYLNLAHDRFFSGYRQNRQWLKLYTCNILLIVAAIALGSLIHLALFDAVQFRKMVIRGYFARFSLSTIMVAVVIRLILLMRESAHKDLVNEQLHAAYLQAQLKLLQEQLNPHFLFNTLSSLSAIVRENPQQAQAYIMHLSKVFRYTLIHSGNDMVTIDIELQHLASYTQLLTMRLGNTFRVRINVGPGILQKRIPHLSLQPLVENAVKHNSSTAARLLTVDIYDKDGWLVVQNNLQPVTGETEGTGLGLANLNGRFKLQVRREIEIHQTREYFMVQLPLL